MKKLIFILLFNIIVLKLSFAQLCGTYTIPGNYPSISSAIAALNSSGISCPVIFLVSAGYKETAANLTINPITGSTFYNRVSFQKSGSGANPKIRAGIGTGSYDGIIKFNGASNVTFDGIDVSDTVTNTNTTTAMEWGYALLRPDAIHGCQYDTIRNCKITLNASVSIATSWGIYAKNMTLTGGGITPTALSGTTSYNAFVSNYITNTYGGIYLYGYADPNYPYDLYDHNNIITSGASAQSTITNFGTSLTISNYTYGVYTYYQNGLQILNTNINNTADGGVPAGAYAYGIYAGSGSNASTAISGNTITLSSSYCCDYICGIYNLSGNTGVDNYINISNSYLE